MATYLFAWNPVYWNWPELPRQIRRLGRNGHVDVQWASGRIRAIEPGSRAFMIRLGVPPKGIIGAGVTVTAPTEGEHWVAAKAAAGIPALVHALYLVNLAAPDDAIYSKSVDTMRATMDAACAIEADAVIFHLGSHLGAGFETGLERVVPALRQVLERSNERTWLLVENSAGAGGTIGRSIDELARITDRLDRHPRLGICLDSCHWYASGVDVTDSEVLDAAVVDLDAKVGLDRLRCLHVNDSQTPLGSNRDRHESVGRGLMGSGLHTFLSHPAFQELPAIMETPGPDGHGPDAAELARLRALHAGEPLASD